MNTPPRQRNLWMKRGWVLLTGLLWPLSVIVGQERALQPTLRFEQLTTVEGLPNNSVNAIAQDSTGYLWIGTWEGLARYNGYEVQTYRTDPGDSTTLSNNRIECLLVDRSGCLWVGTWYGINRYHPESDSFERIGFVTGETPRQSLGQVNAMMEDRRGRLWLGTQEHGLFRFDPEKKQFERFLWDDAGDYSLAGQQVRVLLEDRQGNIWIGTGEPFNPAITGAGLFCLNPETGAVKNYRHDPGNPNSLSDDRVSALHEDHRGFLWIGTCQSGLHRLDPASGEILRLPAPGISVRAPVGDPGPWSACPPVTLIREDQHGGLWVGTYNGGLHRYDLEAGTFQAYYHDPSRKEGLATNEVWSFFEDRSGIIWIATHEAGVQKINPFAQKFRTYQYDPGSLTHPFITGLSISEQEPEILWVGTQDGGLNRLDLRTAHVQPYLHDPASPGSINSNTIWAIKHDSRGNLWVGTDRGLDLLDSQMGIFRHLMTDFNPDNSLLGNTILSLYEDRLGRFWVGAWDGNLYLFDQNREVHQKMNILQKIPSASEGRIYHIFEDENGVLWLSTYLDALYRFDPQSGKSQSFLKGIGANWVHPSEDGHFWVGTNDRGLIRFNPGTGEVIKAFTHAEGLPSNTVFCILEDDQGWLWISTGNGLSHFNPKTSQFINYDESDGLPSNSFNLGSAIQDASGRMFFGGIKGVVLVDPDRIKPNQIPPKMVLTGLKTQRRGEAAQIEKLPPAWNPEEEIPLRHNENDMTFEFVGLHFGSPDQNRYRYRLEPYDKTWVQAGGRRSARYTSLRPGHYVFRVSAANSDGVWNEEGQSVRFYIRPPWWGAWWFRILLGLALAMAAYGIYRYRVNQIRREASTRVAFERKLADEKLSALKAQMNPHFLFNCLNSIDHYIIKNETDKASEYLGNFSRLMRMILQNSRVSFVPLKEELEALRLYLKMESLRFAGNFEYEIRVDEKIDVNVLEVPPMLIQPFVENAIWHGLMHKMEGGKIVVSICRKEDGLHCIVEDNGVGRARARKLEAGRRRSKHRSYGMQITQDRIRMINELYDANAGIEITDLYDDEGAAAGTRVELNLPL
jgi:ligand-binding sensor domain-containing protein